MRRILLSVTAAILAVAIFGANAFAEPRTFRLDPDHLTVAFMAEHIGFAKTLGVFREAKGTIVFDEEKPALHGIDVTIDAASVDTGHGARDEHLRSADFLDAEAHPEIIFALKEARQTGERTGVIVGELTLRGETRPVELDVVWNKSGRYPFGDEHYAVGISARTEIQRSRWGMTYAVENGLVGDEVEIIIEAELIRQE